MNDGKQAGAAVKARAVAMYVERGSLSAIGRVLGYSAPAVLGRHFYIGQTGTLSGPIHYNGPDTGWTAAMVVPQEVTGTPRWQLAREIIAQLREMPAATAEAEVELRLYNVLGFLFPELRYPDIAAQYPSGDGPVDIYCRNAVFETKGPGKLDARRKPDGSIETPEEQAVRYLDALTAPPNRFADAAVGWRAGITDGKEWFFYEYRRDAAAGAKLSLLNALRLDAAADVDTLLAYLYDFVNRTAKRMPPTDNPEWAERQVRPFINLAERYRNTPEYEVKRKLWEGVLRGAFIIPPEAPAARRDLFARHTMLVVIARAVAETLRPPAPETAPTAREQARRTLTEGFAAWLIDAAGADGAAVVDALVSEVNNYAWSAANRDTLKDLYHAVISRDIRHDFGEYYTPDWLARAVCEEVLDAEWRREVIAMAVARQLSGPAVLDPSCGSGTFLFHATQLLLAEAQRHPELAGSPQAQVEIVNELVAGIDLHPVAVELSKATKMLAFGDLSEHYAVIDESATVHLGDSLQWETRRSLGTGELGGFVDIPAVESDDPIRMPVSIFALERFQQLLARIFDYARRPDHPDNEARLLAVSGLTSRFDREAVVALYRRFREYIISRRNNVWEWYVANLIQPLRLSNTPVSRLVGNPPWVVYHAMGNDRQDAFRQHAADRDLWAGANLATQNDLAATFAATCVDYYLQTGGRFGFILPYAALRARHWANFRTGDWSLRQDTERGAHVDLSKDAWDFYRVNAPPFPQANSSVIFGTKVRADRQSPNRKPLAGIQEVTGGGIRTNMAWEEVKPRLTFTGRREWPTAPSPAYSGVFRTGATLFAQSLVLFERPRERARGLVSFRTNPGRGKYRGTERNGTVEERFVKPALFSQLLLPFGATGRYYIIAPFAEDGASLLDGLPAGDHANRFRMYWDRADQDHRERSGAKSPPDLTARLDRGSALSAQLNPENDFKVVYNGIGNYINAAVVGSGDIINHNQYWFSSDDVSCNHYLAAVLNAGCLVRFFQEACRPTDRTFMLLPVQNLPIPAYDAGNEHHANLAAQSALAHARVAALVAERTASRRRINRNDVLRDDAMQPILASIDESARAILPDYCV